MFVILVLEVGKIVHSRPDPISLAEYAFVPDNPVKDMKTWYWPEWDFL